MFVQLTQQRTIYRLPIPSYGCYDPEPDCTILGALGLKHLAPSIHAGAKTAYP